MNPLKNIIIDKIKKEGPITFEAFMDAVLYYPELGYYSSGKTTVGKKGDFYTSPHLHPAFGATLGRQLMEMWRIMKKPSVFHAVEIGAGAGYLCKDIIDHLQKLLMNGPLSRDRSDFLNALRYVIVEPYQHHEKRQREMLVSGTGEILHVCPKLITWVRSLKDLNIKLTGCILSNELLDAFPVHLVEMEDELKEIYVDIKGEEFHEARKEVSSAELTSYLKEFSVTLRSGYRTEINLRIKNWLHEVSATLLKGFLLTVDYGYSASEYYSENRTKGTLLCYNMHQFNEDPYSNIGEQDITTHVNFSSLRKWGEDLGLKTVGYCSQGTFLVASGIDELIKELYADSPDYLFEIAQIKGLIFPQGLGTSHSIMIQYKGEGLPELRGFSIRNKAKSL